MTSMDHHSSLLTVTVVVTGGFVVVVGFPPGVATARRGRASRPVYLKSIILLERR